MYYFVVPKTFGIWANDGACEASGDDKTCGPGSQLQKRTCTDGSTDPCQSPSDTDRTIKCSEAGTELPKCVAKGKRKEFHIITPLNHINLRN